MAKRNIVSCAACRMRRQKCSVECVLAPYFPSDDPQKFSVVQGVYGTKNIIKLLQGVEAAQRDDMVTSMVYEASARLKDPVNGCASEVHQLQKQIAELESQLATKAAELKHMRAQYDNLTLRLATGSLDAQLVVHPTDIICEEVDPLLSWWPLWEG